MTDTSGSRMTVKLGTSLIGATLVLDRIQSNTRRLGPRAGPLAQRGMRVITDARNDLVLALSSEETLFAYCKKTYDASAVFSAADPRSLRDLWPWEEEALAHLFPPPPARLLIGGAGGGREAFALAARGYDITAFDLSQRLCAAAADHIDREQVRGVRYFQGAYEDLPLLRRARPHDADANLADSEPFDAAILGWVSYPHILTRSRRVAALAAMAERTRGPMLVSTFPRVFYGGRPITPSLLRRILAFRMAKDPGNAFRPGPGFSHLFQKDEFLSEIAAAALSVVHLHVPPQWNDRTNCPYAVVTKGSA
jgi:hypothetical protein